MPSKKSCFSATIFCKNLTRFWPVWSAYLLILIFVLPVPMATERFGSYQNFFLPRFIYNGLSGSVLVPVFFFALFAAMAAFSYLYNSRSVQLLHALPVTRKCLFLTNYLSGLSFLVLPILLTGAAALVIQAARGLGFYGTTVLWMFLGALIALFFYSFAVFCAMFTGHILALPAFYFILNFLAVGLISLLRSLFAQFVYGFYRVDWLDELMGWLTPVARLSSEVHLNWDAVSTAKDLFYQGMPAVFLYALVGLALAVLALVAYRRRKLESAGDVISIRWVRPIFKYGVAFCSAIFFGYFLHSIFRNVLPGGIWPLLFCLVVAGVVGCFVAEMLLRKSFKVLRRGWKGALAFSLVLTVAVAAMEFDVLGFDRVPNGNAVASVSFRGVNTYPEDSAGYTSLAFAQPDDIATVLELHRALIAAKPLARGLSDSETRPVPVEREADLYLASSRVVNIYLDYTLENGGTLHRSYEIPIYRDEQNTSGTIPYLLSKLINRPSMYYSYYFGGIPMNTASLVGAYIDLYNTETGEYEAVDIAGEENRNHLLRAITGDFREGNLGYRYLFDDANRRETCAVGDLVLTFYVPDKQDKSADGAPYTIKEDTYTITITPRTTSRYTLTRLQELGIVDDTHLMLTHADNPEDYRLAAEDRETTLTIKK